jgi:hypothetical protein
VQILIQAAYSKVADLTRILAGAGAPAMPDAIRARIERALARESAGRRSGRSRITRPAVHAPPPRSRNEIRLSHLVPAQRQSVA